MELLSLIRKKRAHRELDDAEIADLVRNVVSGTAADYQLSALLMAICYEGLSYRETLALTRAFIASGDNLDWSHLPGPVVDKHSTGGVGDKTSLLLVPWLAAVGLTVPKMSGRGLGHTGGTIDKLESIPRYCVNPYRERFEHILAKAGCAIVAQSANLVPADKHIYALRDATGTVDELGLIAASVMSKKLAAGAQYIVIDVKCGRGAFFTTVERAQEFARVAIRLGSDLGRPVACVISNMDQPLGSAVGNAIEVAEVDDMLRGGNAQNDLLELCVALGSQLLILCGKCRTLGAGSRAMLDAWKAGAVRERFERWIELQGGDLNAFRQQQGSLEGYREIEIKAALGGFVAKLDALRIGELVRSLGAGRMTAEDRIDTNVGVICTCKQGAHVQPDDSIGVMIARPDDMRSDSELIREFRGCIEITAAQPDSFQIVFETVS